MDASADVRPALRLGVRPGSRARGPARSGVVGYAADDETEDASPTGDASPADAVDPAADEESAADAEDAAVDQSTDEAAAANEAEGVPATEDGEPSDSALAVETTDPEAEAGLDPGPDSDVIPDADGDAAEGAGPDAEADVATATAAETATATDAETATEEPATAESATEAEGESDDSAEAATEAEPEAEPEPVAPPEPIHLRVRVQQTGGEPIPGVVLALCEPAGRQLDRSTTADGGHHELTAPAYGAYVLIARAKGYHPHAQAIDVRADLTRLELVLKGESGMYGVVRGAVDEPVAGAVISLSNARGEVVVNGSTAADGTYVLSDLVEGVYTLAVSAPGYRPAAQVVHVPDTGRIRQDVALVGGGHLHGTVRGRTGDPLPDARVSLVDSWGRVVRVTASGPNGQYRFEELPEGEYTLVATMYPPVASGVQVTAGHKHQHDVELAFPEA